MTKKVFLMVVVLVSTTFFSQLIHAEDPPGIPDANGYVYTRIKGYTQLRGVQGVKMTLKRGSSVVETITTNTDGFYQFFSVQWGDLIIPSQKGHSFEPSSQGAVSTLADFYSSLGESSDSQGSSGDPVNTYTGNLTNVATDFSAGGRIPLEFKRTYNSSQSEFDGPLGYGWSHSYDMYIIPLVQGSSDKVSVFLGDGNAVDYFYDSVSNTYQGQKGVYATLTLDAYGTFKLTLTDGKVYTFVPFYDNGNIKRWIITEIKDRNDNTLTFTYKPNTYLIDTISESNTTRSIVFDYNTDNTIKWVKDPGNRYTYYFYTNGNLTGIKKPETGEMYAATYTYDTNHKILTKNDPHCAKGEIEGSFDYYTSGEHAGKVSEARDGIGIATTYTYKYQSSNNTYIQNRRGKTEIHEYDTINRLLKVKDALGNPTSYGYNADFNRTSETDANNNVTDYQYDSGGTHDNPTQVTVKKGPDIFSNIAYEYHSTYKSIVAKVTDLKNPAKVTEYKDTDIVPDGNIDEIKNPDGSYTLYKYYTETGKKGLIKQVIKKLGTVEGTAAEYDYDNKGNLTYSKIPIDRAIGFYTVIRYHYDDLSRKEWEEIYKLENGVETLLKKTTYEWDTEDKLRYITYFANTPDPTAAQYLYNDSHKNRTDVYDENGKRTHYVYDKNDQLTDVYTDYFSDTSYATRTQYIYDAEGNRTDTYQAYTETEQVQTKYTYYDNNRLETVKTVGRSTTDEILYTYYPNGNIQTKKDGTNVTVTYEYEGLNRLLAEKVGSTDKVRYTYTPDDSSGNRKTMVVDPTIGYWSYTYDLMNRLATHTEPTYRGGFTTTYTYDLNGNRQTMTITNVSGYPNGLTWGYTYWDNNWLKSVTDPDGKVTTYDYDALGNRTKVKYPNGVTGTYTYNTSNHRLENITWTNSYGSVLQKFEYTDYDSVGNIKKMNDFIGEHSYTYDNLYQLTQVTYPERGYESFTYDDAGNRKTYTTNIEGYTSINDYIYNNTNELMSGGGITYTYDNNGNLDTKTSGTNVTNFDYDYKNQLTGITYPNAAENTFSYDGDGKRTQRHVDSVQTNYYWDGMNVILETDNAQHVTAIYTHGLELISQMRIWDDQLDKKSKLYYLYDHLGNTRSTTDEWGNIVNTYYYDAFGKCWNVKSDPGNKNQYVGGYGITADEDSGLLYMRMRYYDPTIGRFSTRDIFVNNIHASLELNRYIYVTNNPILWMDTWGLYKQTFWLSGTERFTLGILTALYYRQNPPSTFDKASHYIVSYRISDIAGPDIAFQMGIGKELLDLVGPGQESFSDLWADVQGILDWMFLLPERPESVEWMKGKK